MSEAIRRERERVKELCVQANGLLDGLQRSVGANRIQLKQGSPKAHHEIPFGLESPHRHVKQTGDALFLPHLTHILGNEFLGQPAKGCYRVRGQVMEPR